MGETKKEDSEYLEEYRKKRNIVEYEYAGGASESDAEELVAFVEEFRDEVINWFKKKHPSLIEK